MASMQEYLKRYGSDAEKAKKKKKKKKSKPSNGGALTIVDADPVWQKDIKEDSSESEAEQEDAPMVIEDVEFKRMQRLEALRMRPYLAMADDGSGWVSLSDNQNQGSPEKCTGLKEPIAEDGVDADLKSLPRKKERGSSSLKKETDVSPPRKRNDSSSPRRGRHDSPDLSPSRKKKDSSPPRRGRHDSPDLNPLSQDLFPPKRDSRKGRSNSPEFNGAHRDLSPPRRDSGRVRHDSPELHPRSWDLSPPRRGRHDSSEFNPPSQDLSPPRRESKRVRETDSMGTGNSMDLSPPRRDSRSSRTRDASNNRGQDLSPPRRHLRRGRQDSPEIKPMQTGKNLDLSPPRRGQPHAGKDDKDLSPTRKRNRDGSSPRDLSKHKRGEVMGDGTAAGLQSGRELAKETLMKKKTESKRVKELDLSVSGRNANTVYRDKHGKRLEGVDEILKLQQAEEPKKEEKPLEWGKGLVQKREAEAQYVELEAERMKPFARTMADLDDVLKEQVRWGDPMAHLVKKKVVEPVLADLGASEQMKESGFIIPQDVPRHSWLRRGFASPPNRYGIKPGRHWDGVDRSTGYERDMYKRQNEKKAEQDEAYLWSVADM